jgi:hypothetical protein
MITETTGLIFDGVECGYRWIPSEQRGLEKGSSLGVAVAVIMGNQVVATFPTYPPIWEALNGGSIVDVTESGGHNVAEGHAVVEVQKEGNTQYVLHISSELLAAALTSGATLARIEADNYAVMAGWGYSNGNFTEPT